MTAALLALAAAAAVGYLAGRTRPWSAVVDWAEDNISGPIPRRIPAIAVACIVAALHPVRSWRHLRSWKRQKGRPGPRLRPDRIGPLDGETP